MYEITVEHPFLASHFLTWENGRQERYHSHRWKAAVSLKSRRLNRMHVVEDFVFIKKQLCDVLAGFQEQSINDHPYFLKRKLNPSAEIMAKFVYDQMKARLKKSHGRISRVTVWETPSAWAIYTP